MTSEDNETKTLNNNNVRNFILKIDSPDFNSVIFNHLINALQKNFDRTEVQSTNHLNINALNEKAEVTESAHKEFILISSKYSSSLTLSEVNKAIFVQCNNYVDYTSYIDIIRMVIESLKELDASCSSSRIGMRFINEFKCPSITALKKVFNKRHRAVVNNMLQNEYCSRAVAIEEFNYSDMKSRVQYGVLNKFYPSVIINYDASLDIDVYDDGANKIEDWDAVLKSLNHKAYELFKDSIDEKAILGMK